MGRSPTVILNRPQAEDQEEAAAEAREEVIPGLALGMALRKKNYAPEAKGPLQGVRVLDLSRLVAGNMLTQLLGDFGAEVIKVEPPAGDTLRAWQTNGVATNWKIYARNKKSLCLELRKPEARELLLALVPVGGAVRRELPPRHARGDGPRPGGAARAQPEARHRARLRLGPGRAVSPPARLRHADRRHVGLRGDERLRRPRAGAAADVPGRHVRRPVRRDGGDDRAARSRGERRARAGDRPAAARSAVRDARARRPPTTGSPARSSRAPAAARPTPRRATPTAARTACTSALSASTQKMAERVFRAIGRAGSRSTTRATAPTPTA